MATYNDLLKYLKDIRLQRRIKEYIQQHGLNSLYDIFHGDNFYSEDLTKFLLMCGIDPLDYMDRIYKDMYAHIPITSLTIPKNIKRIEVSGFNSLQLTSLILPDSIEYIGEGAFTFSRVRELTIPKSVKYIGKDAFETDIYTEDKRLMNIIYEGNPKEFKKITKDYPNIYDHVKFVSYQYR